MFGPIINVQIVGLRLEIKIWPEKYLNEMTFLTFCKRTKPTVCLLTDEVRKNHKPCNELL